MMKANFFRRFTVAHLFGLLVELALIGPVVDEAGAQIPGTGIPMGAGIPKGAGTPVEMVDKSTGDLSVTFPKRILIYHMSAGSAKPRRIPSAADGGYAGYGAMGGEGYGGGIPGGAGASGMVNFDPQGGGMPGMGGMASQGMMGEGVGMGGGTLFAGTGTGLYLYALVWDANHPDRANVQVAVLNRELKSAGDASTADQTMDGVMGIDSMEAARPLRLTLIDDADWLLRPLPKTKMAAHTSAELAAVAKLVKLDVWIEDARQGLRSMNSDAESAAVESELRKLLTEEYEQQLAKQTEDIARLSQGLAHLQSELERRSKAKNRVVEVQLGKMVLESQGLLKP